MALRRAAELGRCSRVRVAVDGGGLRGWRRRGAVGTVRCVWLRSGGHVHGGGNMSRWAGRQVAAGWATGGRRRVAAGEAAWRRGRGLHGRAAAAAELGGSSAKGARVGRGRDMWLCLGGLTGPLFEQFF